MHDFQKTSCSCFGCFIVSKQGLISLLLLAALLVLCGFGLFGVGRLVGHQDIREEAIKAGVASDEPVKPEGGFRWKKDTREY